MADISFVVSWPAVPTADKYFVTIKVNGAVIYTLQGTMLTVTRTLSVNDGDEVSAEVVASNVGGDSPPGVVSIIASVVSAPAAPVVSLVQV